MSTPTWLKVAVAGGTALGVTGAAATVGLAARRRRAVHRWRTGDEHVLGSLRSPAVTVVASDGVLLHAEVDEVDTDEADEVDTDEAGGPTIVFVHGWSLNLDCWHFQRATLRGRLRTVLYDQRSHGRSGRSRQEHCTVDQLAADLEAVIDRLAPVGPIVLVGHSMGGMTIVGLARRSPALMRDRVVGVALISTSAGNIGRLMRGRRGDLLDKAMPAILGALNRAPGAMDAGRRFTGGFAYEVTKRFAFASKVPEDFVTFTDQMIAANPMSVFTYFWPVFSSLDLYAVLPAFRALPTVVIVGTEDTLTPVSHARRIAEAIPTAELVVIPDTGHMVLFERHEQVDELLGELIKRASDA
ncbi:MAG: alpha/beta fold hydrolase [Nocardioidaceae bacterium]